MTIAEMWLTGGLVVLAGWNVVLSCCCHSLRWGYWNNNGLLTNRYNDHNNLTGKVYQLSHDFGVFLAAYKKEPQRIMQEDFDSLVDDLAAGLRELANKVDGTEEVELTEAEK